MTDSSPTTIPAAEETHFRWNFAVNVMDIAFFTLAMNVISLSTVMPLLVSRLTDSKVVIGLVPSIFTLGFLLPQLLTASYTERLPRKLPFLAPVSAVGERLPYLFIAAVILLFAERSPGLALGGLLFFLGVAATTAGILTPAWYDLIAKVIPVQRRGLWSGVGFGLGAFMGLAGAALAGQFLERWPYPQNFALCFLAAFVFIVLSWVGLALNREPASQAVKQPIRFTNYLRQLPAVIRRDRNYQVYLISRTVANLGSMAAGFFIVFGSERFGLSGAQVGWLTAVLVGSQTIMNLLWGLLGDRKGHKLVLAGGALAMGLAALTGLVFPVVAALWAIFFFVGMAQAAENVSSLNIILEFCEPGDRPTYIGLTNTLLAPARSLAPLIGGWLATWLGYPALFLAALIFSAAGSLLLGLWMREPRQPEKPAILV